jgi:prepilin-type N-terminal cleavage/methylation domain-containing protein
MKINQIHTRGFTLVEIMIVVAIIGLLSSIAVPNFVRARTTSQVNACINNLRQIDSAKQQWALENKQDPAAEPDRTDIAPYMGRSTGGALSDVDFTCPAAGTYIAIGNVATPPECSKKADGHVLP